MSGKGLTLCVFLALVGLAPLASAQSTTGTISGRVVDAQDRATPGVTVSVTSPNLQGVRTATTSETGNYIITLLPSGNYSVTFELSGFERQTRQVTLAPTQALPLDAKLGLAPVNESVEIVGSTNLLLQTAQVASNFQQELMNVLPTTRDINASVLMAPSVHATGPSGAYSIAGSMSYENLFLINGVTVSENLRGQPYDLYIEDAIQETTVATAGVSAEYGRFGGGVVNVVTKSGGNLFSGSFRDTLNNDNWRALTPFTGDSKLDKTLPAYEYTIGGPVMKDHLWFFAAGRNQSSEERRTLAVTNAGYDFSSRLRRYEAKGTYSPTGGQRIEGAYTRSTDAQTNATFNPATSMDARSLYDPTRVLDLSTVSYSGVLSQKLFFEARVSMRNETLQDIGATSTDLINGTLLIDQSRSARRYWAPTFCGVCDPEERDNQDVFLKGSYFLSRNGVGSHNLVFGYDGFNDHRWANNHQSGSDYRILGTSAIVTGESLTPVFLGNGTTLIQWNPIFVSSEGADFRVHSGFFNDSWRVSPRVTANLGLRFDKNSGSNSAGQPVASDSAWSPRLGVIWDPTGRSEWSVTGSVARYVAGISSSIANSTSAGGNSDTYQFVYRGPAINGNGAVETPTPQAIQQVFDWFNANGGPTLPLTGTPNIPGVTPQIRGSLVSPNVMEYASGVSRNWGSRAAVRADFIYRNYGDFYAARTDMSTGKVTDKLGRTFDLSLIENASHLDRQYSGLNTEATLRLTPTTEVGATYTLSHAWGNVDGESASAGPTTDSTLQYPEYKQASWNYPDGDLSIDQRHRARIWVNYGVKQLNGLTLGALQTLESGVPYGAVSVSGVNAAAYVTNPGYLTPPAGNQTVYYYAGRDAFRTEGQIRTDLAATYVYRTAHRVQLFGQMQVINIFNQFQLCGCGASVAASGGAVSSSRIDQTIRTSVTAPTLYQAFNPFTAAPVQGVNWDYAPTFGTAVNRMAYTSPRALRLTFGVRF